MADAQQRLAASRANGMYDRAYHVRAKYWMKMHRKVRPVLRVSTATTTVMMIMDRYRSVAQMRLAANMALS